MSQQMTSTPWKVIKELTMLVNSPCITRDVNGNSAIDRGLASAIMRIGTQRHQMHTWQHGKGLP